MTIKLQYNKQTNNWEVTKKGKVIFTSEDKGIAHDYAQAEVEAITWDAMNRD